MRLMAHASGASPGPGRSFILLLGLLVGLAWGCGYIRPAPEGINPEDYTPISYEQLRAPRRAGLTPGQKVQVDGYFWQFLEYDPVMVRNYLTLTRQPVAWSRLYWASLYDAPQMRGHYDRLALTRDQKRDWRLKRLEHVRIYGELAPLGLGVIYLQAHQVDRLDQEGETPEYEGTVPEVEQEGTPSP